mmetsp:Transcript_44183/g.42902  ORF Transcript_44183/g.42902 Transcript_44183/m.42902 type:complete len:92 (-) Transcript_44183:94-369(-)
MRQIGDDFKVDPYKSIGTTEVPVPKISEYFAPVHTRWLQNTLHTKSHNYCAKMCLNFKNASMDGNEKSCLTNCFSKYNLAYKALIHEKSLF